MNQWNILCILDCLIRRVIFTFFCCAIDYLLDRGLNKQTILNIMRNLKGWSRGEGPTASTFILKFRFRNNPFLSPIYFIRNLKWFIQIECHSFALKVFRIQILPKILLIRIMIKCLKFFISKISKLIKRINCFRLSSQLFNFLNWLLKNHFSVWILFFCFVNFIKFTTEWHK